MTLLRPVAAGLLATFGLSLAAPTAHAADDTLRIAMTASDIPTTTGAPNNGFEGVRFLGYPAFEGLVLWDLSPTGHLATLKPGLATSWEQAADNKRVWTFHLRPGVSFHDGTKLDADAVIWNLDRFFKTDSPQFEAAGSGLMRARVPAMDTYRKIDAMTVEITTKTAASYFPYQAVYILFTSPASFEKAGHDWGKVATLPAAGTGPFKLETVVSRQSVLMARNDQYWDKTRIAKVGHVLLLPIPEANTRMAALRNGQVDWIEVPPPDGIASLKQAGFNVTTGPYPHVWPWFFGLGEGSPLKDVRVRQALNYCVDRDGLVSLLNGTAQPAVGYFKPADPGFGNPANHYGFDPVKGKALLAEAGFNAQHPLSFKVMISPSGSGQMMPLPMNEFLQENLAAACGVKVDYNVVEWQVLLTSSRQPPDSPTLQGAIALNVSSPSSDLGIIARYFAASSFSPAGFNWEHWSDPQFEAALKEASEATDPAVVLAAVKRVHERLVDDPPWLYIVHDLNPRAMSKRVHGFVPVQSWFVDLTAISLE